MDLQNLGPVLGCSVWSTVLECDTVPEHTCTVRVDYLPKLLNPQPEILAAIENRNSQPPASPPHSLILPHHSPPPSCIHVTCHRRYFPGFPLLTLPIPRPLRPKVRQTYPSCPPYVPVMLKCFKNRPKISQHVDGIQEQSVLKTFVSDK